MVSPASRCSWGTQKWPCSQWRGRPFSLTVRCHRSANGSSCRASVAAHSGREDVEKKLNEAVYNEDYAEAARLRDELSSLPEDGTDALQIQRLLDEAVKAEDFKEAARLRDRLDRALVAPKEEISFSSAAITHDVFISATSAYVPQRSHPDRDVFFFVYQITMTNKGKCTVQLNTRHWTITDANGKVSNVSGAGVVGQKPILGPGASFKYTSACPLGTSQGTMRGTYEFLMLKQDGSAASNVEVDIAPFLLSTSVIGSLGT